MAKNTTLSPIVEADNLIKQTHPEGQSLEDLRSLRKRVEELLGQLRALAGKTGLMSAPARITLARLIADVELFEARLIDLVHLSELAQVAQHAGLGDPIEGIAKRFGS